MEGFFSVLNKGKTQWLLVYILLRKANIRMQILSINKNIEDFEIRSE